MVLVPFVTNDPMIMATHITSSIGMMFHWYLNSDVCFLTQVESYLRGIPSDKSFFYHLVSPIYVIADQKLRKIVWIITILLTCVSGYKFYKYRDVFIDTLHKVLRIKKE